MADRPPSGRRAIAILGLSLIALPLGIAQPVGADTPATTIPMASSAGMELLLKPRTRRADYGALVQWYEAQANLAYCGVASSVMVLNSLAVAAPKAEGYRTNRFWTQTNLFTVPASKSFVEATRVAREGMTLEQLHGLLASVGSRVQRYHGENLSLEQLRWLLRRGLAQGSDRLLANYDRRALGQTGGGHISPLAAYDPDQDRVLILDVARYRYPAVWVATPDLWRAIRSVDKSSGRSRGVLTIEAQAADRPTGPL
jgi:hypothetical protein